MKMPKHLVDVALKTFAEGLEPRMRELVREMATCLDDYRPYVRTLAADLGFPVEEVRAMIRLLDGWGMVTYGPVCDGDTAAPKGSTWWLTERGAALKAALEAGK